MNNYNSIIDDYIFKHEYDYFVKLEFILIKVERYVENNNNYIFNHISESKLEKILYNILVENSGDI